MTPPKATPPRNLIMMVKTLADTKTALPRKQKGILGKEYGVNVEVSQVLDSLHYTAGAGKLMPHLRFSLKGQDLFVRSYKPGDWELAVKRAYDDLVTQSGVFGSLSIKPRETAGAGGKVAGASKMKKKGLFERLMAKFMETED